jgi:anaerobic ribonucleoside-triphosphate reductase
MGLADFISGMLKGRKPARKGQAQKCPSCGEPINLSMERCPKCGVRIKSMFRRKCPKCGTLNELDAKQCTKCYFDFEAEYQRAKKTYYLCPRCGYKMESFFSRCPACNTRLM